MSALTLHSLLFMVVATPIVLRFLISLTSKSAEDANNARQSSFEFSEFDILCKLVLALKMYAGHAKHKESKNATNRVVTRAPSGP
jgi:hypothetical protein